MTLLPLLLNGYSFLFVTASAIARGHASRMHYLFYTRPT